MTEETYPEYYRCELPVPIEYSESLTVSSWFVELSGATQRLVVPPYRGWLWAISWLGASTVNGLPIDSCSPRQGKIGLLPLPPNTVLEGAEGNQVIIAGLIDGDAAPAFPSEVARGASQSLDSAPFEHLFAFLRIIKMDDAAEGTPEEKGARRGAIAVTPLKGPRVDATRFTEIPVGELVFVPVPKGVLLTFGLPEDPQRCAIILDFFSDGDCSTTPDDPPCIECQWRCISFR